MFGLITKLATIPGKRDEMLDILKQSAANMPGCLSYVVAEDASDQDTLWVTELWDSQASHDASLSLPAVKDTLPKAKAILRNFQRIATTHPVWEGKPNA